MRDAPGHLGREEPAARGEAVPKQTRSPEEAPHLGLHAEARRVPLKGVVLLRAGDDPRVEAGELLHELKILLGEDPPPLRV